MNEYYDETDFHILLACKYGTNGDPQIKKCVCSKLTTKWAATHFYNQRLGQRYKWAGDDEKGINISLRESSVT